MKIESRIGKIQAGEEHVFSLISDFNNLQNFAIPDNVKDFNADVDSCSFVVKGMGNFAMKIIEREEFKLVKIANDEGMPFKFNLWIQLKNVDKADVRVKVTLEAELNAMLKVVAKKPLTQFVSTLVDKLESIRQ